MKSFLRAQLAAISATAVDFGTLILWVEGLGLFYAYGVPVAAALGAITNFLMNRYWSFEASHLPAGPQVFRYAWVSLGSLILNTVLVYSVTEFLDVQYIGSKAIVSLVVALFYNYPLHRYFVYGDSKVQIEKGSSS